MKRFKKYQIYINDNVPTEVEIEALADKLGEKTPYHLREMSADLQLEIKKEKTSSPEQIRYEELVTSHLELIEQTMFGKVLLKSLNPRIKIWIIDKREDYYSTCACLAATIGPLAKKDGGDIRIYYTPSFLNTQTTSEYDDILCHELSHAFRRGLKTIDYNRPDFFPAEEFYAVYMQNMYLACRGDITYCKSDKSQKFDRKDELYNFIINNSDAKYYMKYYLENDPLAQKVAKWAFPIFNPWRDFPDLYKAYRKKYIGSTDPRYKYIDL